MEEFILTHGSYLAIVFLLALTGAGLPLPEELVIVAAGVLSSPAVGELEPVPALLACLAGALLGDCVMYGIGRGLGITYLRQHPRVAKFLHADREQQMERIIRQHSLKVFLLARFLVGVRAPIYLAMGIMRIDFRRFLVSDCLCGILVVGTFFWMSYYCGGWIGSRIRESQLALTGLLLVVGSFAGIYYVVWNKCRQQLHVDESVEDETADASIPS